MLEFQGANEKESAIRLKRRARSKTGKNEKFAMVWPE
jgi:hypothetical protein